jgi:hypothetical protein
MNRTKYAVIGFALGAAVLGVLTGCVGYVDEPRDRGAYIEPAPVYVQSTVVEPEYVYYPAYEVYYSGNTHQYVYRDGRSWVSRPAPPRVAPDVLLRSPSVRLDFHDSPAVHHAAVVRQYPKHWAPPQAAHDARDGHQRN